MSLNQKNIWVIVPVYNEESVIKNTIVELQKYFSNVVCVNDGSKDSSLNELNKTNAKIVSLQKNIGQGGALQKGIEFALQNDGELFVTFDADGQHSPKDALEMVNFLKEKKVDIVLGSRFLIRNLSNIPFGKKILLKIAIIFTKAHTGLKITDTHNGLRVFNKKVAEKIKFKNKRMAHASEIFDIIKENKFAFIEYPTKIIYTKYSEKKGQKKSNALKILYEFFKNKIAKN